MFSKEVSLSFKGGHTLVHISNNSKERSKREASRSRQTGHVTRVTAETGQKGHPLVHVTGVTKVKTDQKGHALVHVTGGHALVHVTGVTTVKTDLKVKHHILQRSHGLVHVTGGHPLVHVA